ncbi:MAG: hypothetical protein ABIH90_03175, partial [Candidatus Aenigmatarchaeota archaeon]
GIVKDGEKYVKKRIQYFTIYDVFRLRLSDRFIHSIGDEGLSESDVEKIKKLWKSGKLSFNTIKIHISVPFAPFLFFGFFLTILAEGNFIDFLRGIL